MTIGDVKFSKITGSVAWSGGTLFLRLGQTIDVDHPLVTERPDLFNDTDPGASLPAPGGPTVERATAAPGEVRNTPGAGPRGGVIRVPKSGSVQ